MAGGDREAGADRRGEVGRGGGGDGETQRGGGVAEPDSGFGFQAHQCVGQVTGISGRSEGQPGTQVVGEPRCGAVTAIAHGPVGVVEQLGTGDAPGG